MVDPIGDIQDKEDVTPAPGVMSWFELIEEIVTNRGGAHVYYPNHRDEDGAADDIHLDADRTYFDPQFNDDSGLIFTQTEDGEQLWLDPEKVLYVEKHY